MMENFSLEGDEADEQQHVGAAALPLNSSPPPAAPIVSSVPLTAPQLFLPPPTTTTTVMTAGAAAAAAGLPVLPAPLPVFPPLSQHARDSEQISFSFSNGGPDIPFHACFPCFENGIGLLYRLVDFYEVPSTHFASSGAVPTGTQAIQASQRRQQQQQQQEKQQRHLQEPYHLRSPHHHHSPHGQAHHHHRPPHGQAAQHRPHSYSPAVIAAGIPGSGQGANISPPLAPFTDPFLSAQQDAAAGEQRGGVTTGDLHSTDDHHYPHDNGGGGAFNSPSPAATVRAEDEEGGHVSRGARTLSGSRRRQSTHSAADAGDQGGSSHRSSLSAPAGAASTSGGGEGRPAKSSPRSPGKAVFETIDHAVCRVGEPHQRWAFYNDTEDTMIQVCAKFAVGSQLSALGNTWLTTLPPSKKHARGSSTPPVLAGSASSLLSQHSPQWMYQASLEVPPGQTVPFVEGLITSFSLDIHTEAVPVEGVVFENGAPAVEYHKVFPCFKHNGNGLLFRLVNEHESTWYFYNDTLEYVMRVVADFAVPTEISPLGDTEPVFISSRSRRSSASASSPPMRTPEEAIGFGGELAVENLSSSQRSVVSPAPLSQYVSGASYALCIPPGVTAVFIRGMPSVYKIEVVADPVPPPPPSVEYLVPSQGCGSSTPTPLPAPQSASLDDEPHHHHTVPPVAAYVDAPPPPLPLQAQGLDLMMAPPPLPSDNGGEGMEQEEAGARRILPGNAALADHGTPETLSPALSSPGATASLATQPPNTAYATAVFAPGEEVEPQYDPNDHNDNDGRGRRGVYAPHDDNTTAAAPAAAPSSSPASSQPPLSTSHPSSPPPVFLHGEPNLEIIPHPTQIIRCFKEHGNGLLFRLIDEELDIWAFYNDTTGYVMKATVEFPLRVSSDVKLAPGVHMETVVRRHSVTVKHRRRRPRQQKQPQQQQQLGVAENAGGGPEQHLALGFDSQPLPPEACSVGRSPLLGDGEKKKEEEEKEGQVSEECDPILAEAQDEEVEEVTEEVEEEFLIASVRIPPLETAPFLVHAPPIFEAFFSAVTVEEEQQQLEQQPQASQPQPHSTNSTLGVVGTDPVNTAHSPPLASSDHDHRRYHPNLPAINTSTGHPGEVEVQPQQQTQPYSLQPRTRTHPQTPIGLQGEGAAIGSPPSPYGYQHHPRHLEQEEERRRSTDDFMSDARHVTQEERLLEREPRQHEQQQQPYADQGVYSVNSRHHSIPFDDGDEGRDRESRMMHAANSGGAGGIVFYRDQHQHQHPQNGEELSSYPVNLREHELEWELPAGPPRDAARHVSHAYAAHGDPTGMMHTAHSLPPHPGADAVIQHLPFPPEMETPHSYQPGYEREHYRHDRLPVHPNAAAAAAGTRQEEYSVPGYYLHPQHEQVPNISAHADPTYMAS